MDRLNWKQIAVPAIFILLVGGIVVFAHSGLQGTHGLSAYREAGEQERRLRAELASLRTRREALENKVERLSARRLDLDLLDERARAVLGLVREDELVIR